MPGRYKMVRCDGTCSESSVSSEGKRSVVLRAATVTPAAGRSRDGLMRLKRSAMEKRARILPCSRTLPPPGSVAITADAAITDFTRPERGHGGVLSRHRNFAPPSPNRLAVLSRRARGSSPRAGGGLRAGCCRASSTRASPSCRGAGRGPRTGACASRAAR